MEKTDGNDAKPNASSQSLTAQIKSVDMSDDMQHEAVDICVNSCKTNTIEKDIAAQIKKELDQKYGPTWHVVVGRSFGSFVTHETKHFLYAYVGEMAVLLFKSG